MAEFSIQRVTPILRADDAAATARWYERLGFEVEWEHRFEPGFPLFVSIRTGEQRLFLSEHGGDAVRGTLVYLHVDDVDAVARALGVEAEDMPWGMREVGVTDPSGNRLRLGSPIA